MRARQQKRRLHSLPPGRAAARRHLRRRARPGTCRIRVLLQDTPLHPDATVARDLILERGTPLVWVLGMLTRASSTFDSLVAQLDAGRLRVHMNGRNLEWFDSIDSNGWLVLDASA